LYGDKRQVPLRRASGKGRDAYMQCIIVDLTTNFDKSSNYLGLAMQFWVFKGYFSSMPALQAQSPEFKSQYYQTN
jgi:hypothetical protein